MDGFRTLKNRLFRGGIRRTLLRYENRFLRRTTVNRLVKCIEELDIPRGAAICVHSKLSGIGHLMGGPKRVIHALRKAVPDCTVMMPTFPFSGTMEQYLAGNPVFDRENTPSRSGMLSEALRTIPEAKRSCHPTHPCVALGSLASDLIDGSEESETPFGDDSTYGRFSRLDNGYLLMLETNNTSYVHRLQELVDMPNLFLRDPALVRYSDQTGQVCARHVRVHTPLLPLFVIIAGDDESQLEYVWFPDYVLPFPEYNRTRIRNNIGSARARQFLFRRHEEFLEKGIVKEAALRDARLLVIRLPPWTERLREDLRKSLREFASDYEYDKLVRARDAGRLRQ